MGVSIISQSPEGCDAKIQSLFNTPHSYCLNLSLRIAALQFLRIARVLCEYDAYLNVWLWIKSKSIWVLDKNSVNRSQKLCERKAYGPSHIQSIQRAPRDTMKCSLSQLEKQINRYGSQHMQLPLGFQALKTRCKVTVVEAYFPL